MLIDIDSLWVYGDPASSERRFRDALRIASGDDALELLTQVARTYSLRGRFEDAHLLLDELEPAQAEASSRARVRYLLERGRTFNSDSQPEVARQRFLQAWELAKEDELDGLAVDAAHMVAITYSGTTDGVQWNRRGLAVAEASSDAKAHSMVAPILNNLAWDLYDLGNAAEAVEMFQAALEAWSKRGKPEQIRIARESLADCLRALGRDAEALRLESEAAGAREAKPPIVGVLRPQGL
jgi:tetratricopeptide (TPR) repeat protein